MEALCAIAATGFAAAAATTGAATAGAAAVAAIAPEARTEVMNAAAMIDLNILLSFFLMFRMGRK